MPNNIEGSMCGPMIAVTRTDRLAPFSQVRPELLFGTFKCLECSHVVHSIEQQFKFTGAYYGL